MKWYREVLKSTLSLSSNISMYDGHGIEASTVGKSIIKQFYLLLKSSIIIVKIIFKRGKSHSRFHQLGTTLSIFLC